MKNCRFAFVMTLCLLLSACASTTDLANELYEAGDYDSAIRMYNKALKQDPENNEAKIGLFKTRKRWINAQLINVRKARLSQNFESAITLMQGIFTNQSQWDMSPDAAAFSTQRQEAEILSEYISRKIKQKINAHPIAANRMIKQHQRFYESPGRSLDLKKISQATYDSGVAQCKKLKDSAQGNFPFFTMFTNQYCNYWGVTSGHRDIAALTANAAFAFSSVSIKGNIDGIDSRSQALISSNVQKALEASPWFNPQSNRKIVAQLSGRFDQRHERRPTVIHEDYTVDIPYTAYESREESYQEPYNSLETVVDPKTGETSQKNVTRYRTQYRTVQAPVTKYRQEGRTQTISGHHYEQSLLLSGGLKLRLGRRQISVPINNQYNVSGLTHTARMPAIGIYPRPDKSVDPLPWLQSSLESNSTKLQTALNKEWVNRYCPNSFDNSSMVSFINSVYKCNASPLAKIDEEINNWFRNRHGLNFATLLDEVEKGSDFSKRIASH